jgi:hypothetical protein
VKLQFQNRTYNDLREFSGLRIWQKPNILDTYAIGADVAEGVGGDASVACVVNCNSGMHIATYWSNSVDIDTFSSELYKLGSWYNKAFLCIEANNTGNGVIALLGGAVGALTYPNLYRRMEYNEYTQRKMKTIGFRTMSNTKPRLLGNLNAALKSGDLVTYDKDTIQELSSFVRDSKTGRLAAKGNAHDDRVMALALAWEQARLLRDGLKYSSGNSLPAREYDPMTGFPL